MGSTGGRQNRLVVLFRARFKVARCSLSKWRARASLLTREQDYAYAQPSLTRHKTRKLELAAGAPSRKGRVQPGHGARQLATRDAERTLALTGENAYRRTIADWQPTRPATEGASVTRSIPSRDPDVLGRVPRN
jgi:hypothetical protein